MEYKLIISDWNGTLTSSSEADANKAIGYTMLADTKHDLKRGKIWRTGTLLKLVAAKKATEIALAAYEAGGGSLADVYAAFNVALKGEDPDYINGIVDRFARETVNKIDHRVLRPIAIMRNGGGYESAIVSVANRRVIEKTLRAAGGQHVAFGYIVANSMITNNGKVERLTLDIYGEKPEVIDRFFFAGPLNISGKRLESRFRPDNTFYLGDDPKDDGPVADLLPRGHFIVPFLASDAVKQLFAERHNAFVPKDEHDMEKYLRAA